MLSLKEQLIVLQLEKVSLALQWQYFRQLLALKLQSYPLKYSYCQQIINYLIKKGCWPEKEQAVFSKLSQKSDSYWAHIHKLSQCSLLIGEADYPKLWLEIPQPPLLIYFKGNIQQLHQPLVSIAGTRQTSDYGRQLTHEISRALVEEGWQVVAGLGEGTDQNSHQAAIRTKDHSTIAILATGFEEVYPREHAQLQSQMVHSQLLLSEFLPHQKAEKHHFMMRNRLIAGISPATLLIEASKKDTALYKIHFALEGNREIFALPGRITDTRSAGCNSLIAQGARPILSKQQLIQDLSEIFKAHDMIEE